MSSKMLKTRYLMDPQLSPCRSDVHQCFNFKAVAIRGDKRQAPSPERVIPITEVAILPTPNAVDNFCESPIAHAPQQGNVSAPTASDEATALREVRSCQKSSDETRYLTGVGGAVPVQHHDHITGCSPEAACEGVALAFAGLSDNGKPRP